MFLFLPFFVVSQTTFLEIQTFSPFGDDGKVSDPDKTDKWFLYNQHFLDCLEIPEILGNGENRKFFRQPLEGPRIPNFGCLVYKNDGKTLYYGFVNGTDDIAVKDHTSGQWIVELEKNEKGDYYVPVKISGGGYVCEGFTTGTYFQKQNGAGGASFHIENKYALGMKDTRTAADHWTNRFASGLLTGSANLLARTIKVNVTTLYDPVDLATKTEIIASGSNNQCLKKFKITFEDEKVTEICEVRTSGEGTSGAGTSGAGTSGSNIPAFEYKVVKCLDGPVPSNLKPVTLGVAIEKAAEVEGVVPKECVSIPERYKNFVKQDDLVKQDDKTTEAPEELKMGEDNKEETEGFFYIDETKVRASYFQKHIDGHCSVEGKIRVFVFFRGFDSPFGGKSRSFFYQNEAEIYDLNLACDEVIIEYFGIEVLEYKEERVIKNALEALKAFEQTKHFKELTGKGNVQIEYMVFGFSLGCAYGLSLSDQLLLKGKQKEYKGRIVEVRVAGCWPSYDTFKLRDTGKIINLKKGNEEYAIFEDSAYNNIERIQLLSKKVPVFVYLGWGDLITWDMNDFMNKVCAKRDKLTDDNLKASVEVFEKFPDDLAKSDIYQGLDFKNHKWEKFEINNSIIKFEKEVKIDRYEEKLEKCEKVEVPKRTVGTVAHNNPEEPVAVGKVLFHTFRFDPRYNAGNIGTSTKDLVDVHKWISNALLVVMTDFEAMEKEKKKVFPEGKPELKD